MPLDMPAVRDVICTVVADEVDAQINVYPYLPAAWVHPSMVVTEDDPYLEQETFSRGPVRAGLRLVVSVAAQHGDDAARTLDRLAADGWSACGHVAARSDGLIAGVWVEQVGPTQQIVTADAGTVAISQTLTVRVDLTMEACP